jgi:hypothetical protein
VAAEAGPAVDRGGQPADPPDGLPNGPGPDVDIERLAERVYRLLRAEARLALARSASPKGRRQE